MNATPPDSTRHTRSDLWGKLSQAIDAIATRLRIGTPRRDYRPEQHYMRGAGPKSLQRASGDGAPPAEGV